MNRIPMNLQFFAEPVGSADSAGVQQQASTGAANQQTDAPQIDYTKIQQMLDGTLAAKEDTALKAFFKQQGLRQDEMEQAIAAFKQQKSASQPDMGTIQAELAQARVEARQAVVDKAATLAGIGLGIDVKTLPYVIKMTDLSQAVGQDGKINDEAITNTLKKVLEDVPGFKSQPGQSAGFIQVGASGGISQQPTTDDLLKKAFGL